MIKELKTQLKKYFKNITIYLLILLMAVSLYMMIANNTEQVKDLGYNDMLTQIESGNVEKIDIQPDESGENYYLSGELKDGTKFTSLWLADTNITKLLQDNGVTDIKFHTVKKESRLFSVIISFLPVLLLIGLMFFMMNQGQGGGKVMQFGKSRAKLHTDDKKRVTFKDVAGVDEVTEELAEVVDFLKSPKKYTLLGAKIPKGVLLYGPPGTGKTLLAKAVAGEAGVPFFTISGSDFVEMFVGVGASRVRDLFDNAKKQAPCIIFIDEIDAVGRQRGAGVGGGHDEREQTLNQLLVEMDGFSANEGIIVVAGTNRPDILDPALLRPGRFDRQISVNAPDVKGREDILNVHIIGKPLAKGIDLKVIAKRTPGFTGADLANLLNEAALLAARRNKVVIEMPELEDAVERIIAGPEKKSRVISDKEKKLVSYHEAGHAVVSYYLPHMDPLHKISIIPRGRAGGYTLLLPEEDVNYITKTKMEEEAVMFLGGRVAEQLVLGDISTGASNDLERATDMVRQMITKYGMSEELGPLTFGKDTSQVFLGRELSHERNYSDAIAYAIDKEATRMMEAAYAKAVEILTEHMDKLHAVAAVLMDKETIDAEEFYAIVEGKEYSPHTEDDKPNGSVSLEKDQPKASGKDGNGEAMTATSWQLKFGQDQPESSKPAGEQPKQADIQQKQGEDPMERWLRD